MSASTVGGDEQHFDGTTIGLSSNTTIPGPSIFQTLSGGKNIPQTVFQLHTKNPLTGQDQIAGTFNGPEGEKIRILGRSVIPTVISPQLGIGISRATEVMIRFLPASHFTDRTTASVYGLGIKHTLTETIFGTDEKIYKDLPPFDIAAYAGFTKETITYNINIQPAESDRINSGNSATDYSRQKARMNSSDFTAGALISRSFSFFSPHIGIAWSAATTRLAFLGNYPMKVTMVPGYSTLIDLKNPFLVSNRHWGIDSTIGFNLDLGFFRINSDLILSKYTRFNLGINCFF